MKYNRLFLTISLFLFTQFLFAQSCLPNGKSFKTQVEVNNFATDYPGCKVIEGSVYIGSLFGQSTISQLDGLSQIDTILGRLGIINNNNWLTSFAGLDNLDYVGEDLWILENHTLSSLEGLENLDFVGGDLIISRDVALDSISVLSNLTHVGGDIEILGNSNLQSLIGLESLSSINNLTIKNNLSLNSLSGLEPFSVIDGSVIITNNNKLTSLEGLHNLDSLGRIEISSNSTLSSLEGIRNLRYLEGSFEMYQCPKISNLSGLENLTTIGRSLRLGSNKGLKNLGGLESLTSVGWSLWIHKNNQLINLDELANITDFGQELQAINADGDITISKNYNLKDIKGLSGISNVWSVLIDKNSSLISLEGLENIDSIKGSLTIDNNGLMSLLGLDNLTSIDKDLKIENNGNLISTEALSNVSFVGDNISIISNIHLETLTGMNGLQTINGNLVIRENKLMKSIVGMNQLKDIGGSLIIENNKDLNSLIGLQSLITIGKDLKIRNSSLSNFMDIGTLSTLGGRLEIRSNFQLKDLSGFGHLYQTTGISIHGNPALQNLKGLHNLAKSFGSVYVSVNDSLRNLMGLNSLKSVDGSTIEIRNNDMLESLEGLEQLAFAEFVSINGNPRLINLDGLSSLTKTHGPLTIFNNSMLLDIDGVRNIDPNSIKSEYAGINDLEIFGNTKLSQCSVKSICGALSIAGRTSKIENNAPGCNSVGELDCSPYYLSGYVFYDFNQNKQFDPMEVGLGNMLVNFSSIDNQVLTGENGNFYQFCDSGTVYKINWVQDPDWTLTTDSSSYFVQFEPDLLGNSKFTFGVYPNFSSGTGAISFSSNQTRCNTIVDFYLRYMLLGTSIESGHVVIYYDPTCRLVSTTPTSDVVIDTIGHTITYSFDSIFPFLSQDKLIRFEMPDETSTNLPLHFLVEEYKDSLGIPVFLEEYRYEPVVKCSFDPNDKQVMPFGAQSQHYTLHDHKLTYTIRFQNTGNAEAIDIRISDKIDSNLDIKTLKVINSSFPVQTYLNGHDVEFFFRNIWLPDSTSNEPASHGFVTFEILPIAGLNDYSEIENTASIVFDQNPAVITNTTLNTMITIIPDGLEEVSVVQIYIQPNPANDVIWVMAENQEIVDDIQIYNQLGQVMLVQKNSNVDISRFPNGVYFVKARVGKRVVIEKLVVE